jgi:hypothetical protein
MFWDFCSFNVIIPREVIGTARAGIPRFLARAGIPRFLAREMIHIYGVRDLCVWMNCIPSCRDQMPPKAVSVGKYTFLGGVSVYSKSRRGLIDPSRISINRSMFPKTTTTYRESISLISSSKPWHTFTGARVSAFHVVALSSCLSSSSCGAWLLTRFSPACVYLIALATVAFGIGEEATTGRHSACHSLPPRPHPILSTPPSSIELRDVSPHSLGSPFPFYLPPSPVPPLLMPRPPLPPPPPPPLAQPPC